MSNLVSDVTVATFTVVVSARIISKDIIVKINVTPAIIEIVICPFLFIC